MSSVQMEALDFRYLLLEYYKKLRLSENEVMVILMIDHLLEQKNTLITPDLLSLKMNISSKELDKILVSLLERDLIVYDMGKKVKVSLKSLHKKLYETFQVALSKEQESLVSEKKAAYLKNIYEVFEKQLNRTLSPLEFSMIGEWVNDGFDDETIIRALNEALSKGKKTIRSVDRILVQYKAKEDMEKTGMSNVKEVWDDDMESLLEVAKAKWIDD
ncbi:MAG: DnaD domain protein [Bacilli bacterium]|nr:DnaD domain protein [Erysipelotrichaceae bacterium]MDY4819700.1 DnaD domain protein [Bacilli bacterium]MDY5669132.1 DnaD domain protein [Bacilli bacterium]